MMNRRRRDRRSPAHQERWLVSYADFITLLFAFFVVLYASAQSDQKRAAKVSSAIEEAFEQLGIGTGPARTKTVASVTPEIRAAGANPSNRSAELANASTARRMTSSEIGVLRDELQQALPIEIDRRDVTLRTTEDGLVVSLQEIGFFQSGSATLRPSSEPAFARIAAVLRKRQCRVRVEGHTDRIPIHTSHFASNWELSTARATAVVRRLIQEYGMNPGDLSAGGYAEFHPIAPNDTPGGRALNRRVDLVILSTSLSDDQRK